MNNTVLQNVKNGKRRLKAAVRQAASSESMGTGQVWLCDNAPLLLSSFEACVKYTREHPHTDFSRLLKECEKAVKEDMPPKTESITARFSSLSLTLKESEGLLCLLRTAYALRAARSREDEKGVAFCIKSLRALEDVSEKELLPKVCKTEALLCTDPSGIYPMMNGYSKSRYRSAVERLARKSGRSEAHVAEEALKKAQSAPKGEKHIGFFLPVNEKKKYSFLWLWGEIIIALVLSAIFGVLSYKIWVALLLPLPVFALVRTLSGLLTPKVFKPRQMLSLDPQCTELHLPSAVITVSSLLPNGSEAHKKYAEFAALRSSDSNPHTAVLGLFDLKNSPEPFVSSDKAHINAMKEVFRRLNEDFGGGFVMAVRDRVYSPTEKEYTGHERKRGAISALIRYLTEGTDGFSVLYGDTQCLKDKKYILALDSDTELSFEVLRTMLCVARHPLNRPRFDPKSRKITEGYGCVVPRTETSLASSCKTLFSSVFTSGGATAYSPVVSERYMDMFGTSLFTGKGLIDVEAYSRVCLNAFDEGIILSHDIPEGALLRTGFAGNALFTDSFPRTPSSYFRRMERWIRGDIQNGFMLFGGTSKSKASPRLDPLARYQLWDNIRNALTPVMCLVCLLAGALTQGKTALILTALALLGACSEGLVACVGDIISGGLSSLMRTFFSSSLSQGLRSLFRAFFALGTLPLHACVSLEAVVRALYRITVSKKHTLQWTTASDSDKNGGKNLAYSLAFPLIYGFALILLSPLTAFFGFVILCFIPFSLSDGVPLKNHRQRLTPRDRDVLMSYMSSMWDFFARNVNGSQNFLPPDNVQETPVRAVANRTSPTNIGLYLVSTLAAADVSLITRDELFQRLTATFSTLKELMRYKGLLYNWYDTKTLMPLKPLFISTVDCGNLEVCLIALAQGLLEYAKTDIRFSSLAKTAEELSRMGDMTSLYNKKRDLFSIGLDVSTNTLSDSFYDLFMSEAVMTSYCHIAKRHIPVSHWGKLGRPLVKAGSYTGALSWTGTMFEYFMPQLFLPLYENSFRYEALKVCLYQQKAFAGKNMPYGVSESGYYAFDSALSYRYRANGIRRLALKRNADCEKIFSPYSTFLTLCTDKSAALKNLSKFASLHALGKYGFYEAVDFSAEKNSSQDYMLVRSYMAHHVGMSIIACANAVNDNIFVKRFMSDRLMLSADSLLHEKLPFDQAPQKALFKSREEKSLPSQRNQSSEEAIETGAKIFTNGEDQLVCSYEGGNKFIHSSLSVLGCSQRSRGIFAAVGTPLSQAPRGSHVPEQTKPPLPLFDGDSALKKTGLVSEKEINGLKISSALVLLNNYSALALPVKIENKTGTGKKVPLYFYGEPDFSPPFAPESHPLFDAMMIACGFDKRLNALVFSQKKENAPGIALAMGFYDNSPFAFETERELALGRSVFRKYPFEEFIPEFTGSTQCITPCAAMKLNVFVPSGKKCEKVLLTVADETPQGALSMLARIRSAPLPDIGKCAPEIMSGNPFAMTKAREFASNAYFSRSTKEQIKAAQENTLPLSELWKWGISADLPLLRIYSDSLPQGVIEDCIRLHKVLAQTGSLTDLVFITSFTGDYLNSLPPELARSLKKLESDASLGKKGGVHILSQRLLGEQTETLMAAIKGAGVRG